MNVTLDTGGSTLMAVPARHYCSPFAREVNRLCSDEDSRPEAIAVELGPLMTRELARWMAELGTSPGKKSPLPCMLGILASNRLIDVSKRNTALFLQEYYSVGLSEVDPEILRELLDFAGDHLMCLSATDSMIEAIRCALEYGIPLFGVDLEEFVRGPGLSHPLTEEPGYCDFDLARFVAINEPAAARARDARADQRRETAMAARLKKLLSQSNRVLFTCGLAHWGSIRALLQDPALRPADLQPSFTPSLTKVHLPPSSCTSAYLTGRQKSDLPSPSFTPSFRRVIVHPTMALAFIDTFPIMTTLYDNARNSPDLHAESGFTLPDPGVIAREILTKSYQDYFDLPEKHKSPENFKPGVIPDFDRLLAALTLEDGRRHPNMADMLNAAKSMMPESFYPILLARIMEIGRPWASPQGFPGTPVISDRSAVSGYLAGTPPSKGDELAKEWEWKDQPRMVSTEPLPNDWIWPPCEALLFGSAWEAQIKCPSRVRETYSSPFEGDPGEGIDLKTSLRSTISGEEKLYVKRSANPLKPHVPDPRHPEPVVFIFEDSPSVSQTEWSLLMAGSGLGKFVRNKAAYREVVRKYGGSCFISSINLIREVDIPPELAGRVGSVAQLIGVCSFGSPCMNARQGAQWIEDNFFSSCPVLPWSSMSSLLHFYHAWHGMKISPEDSWQLALIRFALPLARQRMVVVAPDSFTIPVALRNEAARSRISVDLLPLSTFSEERIKGMRNRLTVKALDPDGFYYSAETEQALGRADQHFDLLPAYMRRQLKGR